ncbi:MAG: sigma-54-dependent Fis family transcriptional regulator, partial [Desulfomonile tiedjei]|nr:sigma-54-dependent Fis family transcriptional regulator [Desulfomonile tiedjei]
AIQEKSFFRVGGTKAVTVDVRLIVATNEDLNAAVRNGSFSRDLFYRLSEFTIIIPPLRNRKEDMLHIANRLLEATNTELSKRVSGFSQEAIRTLTEYSWPGNIRQLRSAVRRAVLQADGWIEPVHLSLEESLKPETDESAASPEFKWTEGLSLKEMVRRSTADLEKRILVEALRKTGGNKAKAARLLQMDYTTIHAKIKQYKITVDSEDDT